MYLSSENVRAVFSRTRAFCRASPERVIQRRRRMNKWIDRLQTWRGSVSAVSMPIFQVNTRWKGLDEIYKIYILLPRSFLGWFSRIFHFGFQLLHRSDLNISTTFFQTFLYFKTWTFQKVQFSAEYAILCSKLMKTLCCRNFATIDDILDEMFRIFRKWKTFWRFADLFSKFAKTFFEIPKQNKLFIIQFIDSFVSLSIPWNAERTGRQKGGFWESRLVTKIFDLVVQAHHLVDTARPETAALSSRFSFAWHSDF
jgi:hypothetical protein